MKNKLVIKICGMKCSSNREALEDLPVDIFGFIFHPHSPRNVGEFSCEDLSALTSTSKMKAGVFVDSPATYILETARLYALDFIQLHGNEPPSFCSRIRSSGLKVIKVFRVDDLSDFSDTIPFAKVSDFFLFDTKSAKHGGSGQKFNWQILNKNPCQVPFFLSGGITPSDAGTITQLHHPSLYGIDLNSGFEDEPGVKNILKIKSFIDLLLK